MAEIFRIRGAAGTLVGDERRPEGDPRATLLMLHGGAQTRFSWNRSAERLVGAGYRVLTIDARGHGDSDWSPDGNYDIFEMVSDLDLMVEQLCADDPEPPVLVGASMGGLTGLMALGEGRRVGRALVLVDVTPRLEPSGVERIHDFLNSAPDGFATLEEVADAISAYQPQRRRHVNLDGLRKNVRQRENGRWYWHWDPRFAMKNLDAESAMLGTELLTGLARKVTVPTLLIRGQHSDIVSDRGVDELRELMPHAHTHEVDGAGHMVAGDDNDVFLGQLGWFLDEVVGV